MNTKPDAKKCCNAMAGAVGSVVEGIHCMFIMFYLGRGEGKIH